MKRIPKPATRAVGLRRLLMLAEKLEQPRALNAPGFYYSRWVGKTWDGTERNLCQTTCCALGLGTTIPALRRAGLRLFLARRLCEPVGYVGLAHEDQTVGPIDIYGRSLAAAQEVFCLSGDESLFVFVPNASFDELPDMRSPKEYAEPTQVAAHIRNFVSWAKNKMQEDKSKS